VAECWYLLLKYYYVMDTNNKLFKMIHIIYIDAFCLNFTKCHKLKATSTKTSADYYFYFNIELNSVHIIQLLQLNANCTYMYRNCLYIAPPIKLAPCTGFKLKTGDVFFFYVLIILLNLIDFKIWISVDLKSVLIEII